MSDDRMQGGQEVNAMRSDQPDYYAALGLPQSATPEAIKKRYRELARRYHPDVNPGPEAANKIKAINEAYHVLGDSDRRAIYNAERWLSSAGGAGSASSGSSSAASHPPPRSTPPENKATDANRPSASSGSGTGSGPRSANYGFDGFGRTGDPPRPSTPPRAETGKNSSAPGPAPAARTALVEGYLKEAQLAFINHHYREAEEFCRKTLALERRNATAQEILGDIFLKQNRREEAGTAYSYAVQFNPRNLSAQAKLERLMGGSLKPEKGPTMTRPVSGAKAAWRAPVPGAARETATGIVAAVLAGLFVLITIYWYRNMGGPLRSGGVWLFVLSVPLMTVLIADGLIAGILLALYGGLRPASEELVGRGTKRSGAEPFPLGLMLGMFSIIWFGASLIIYIGTSLAKGRVSPSLNRVYGTTIGLTLLFAALYQPPNLTYGGWETALFAGNLLFPALLAGWAVGDALRLSGMRSVRR